MILYKHTAEEDEYLKMEEIIITRNLVRSMPEVILSHWD